MIFKPFLSDLHDEGYDFGKDKSNIKKEEQENYISYIYKIHDAKDNKNNGLCIEVKICYNRELNSGDGTPMMNGIDISLSKNNEVITKITKNI